MQARLILMLRPVVIWLTQAVITGIAFWIIDKLFDKMLDEIKENYGLSDDDTRIVIANNLLEAATFIGVGSATVASKIPIKLAKKLGFANGKVVKRVISKEGAAKIAVKDGAGAAAKISGTVTTEAVAAEVAATRGIALAKVNTVLNVIGKVVGIPTAFFFAFAQYIDFANWQGPYQHFFQSLLAKIGINPDTPMPKASVVSPDIWKRIYSTIEELEPVGISFPFSGVDKPYSRLNLADVVDEVAAKMAQSGTSTSYKNVLGVVLPLIQLKDKERSNADIDAIFAKISTTSTGTTKSVSVAPITKVFTGIVSQGVVGQGLVFTPRPDDMIDSVDELREAAANNLAPFLNTLLGKIVYEVKVVASVITKDGFKQSGTTQRIQTGTDKNGNATYKTVTNKFAILVVYALTDKGTRAKLTTIVLGPTNSAKLTVGQNDLRTLETQLPAEVTTTDINAIKGIETANPITVSTPPQAQAPAVVAPTPTQKTVIIDKNVLSFAIGAKQDGQQISIMGDQFIKRGGEMYRVSDNALAVEGVATYVKDTGSASVSDTGTVVSIAGTNSPKAGANASTLSDWYQAQGQSLPSVSARATIYEQYGLGQAIYYTGTAEQNTRLLNELKAR